VAKVTVRAVLGASLVLMGGPAWAGGELDRGAAPAVRNMPAAAGRESKVRVYLPTADARLYFDGTLTRETGPERVFRAPGLDGNKRYGYRLLAVWVENGREVTHEANIAFWGGDDVAVSFRR
jgi:uncharacterized protein (TIGR03000 family)